MTDREALVGFEEFVREHVLRILLALDNRGVLRGKLSVSLIRHLDAVRAHLDGRVERAPAAPGAGSDTGKLAALRSMRLERRPGRGYGKGRALSDFGRACRAVACSTCGAVPGSGCVSTCGGGPTPNYHYPRKAAALKSGAGRVPT